MIQGAARSMKVGAELRVCPPSWESPDGPQARGRYSVCS